MTEPFEAIAQLNQDHPYKKIGEGQIEKALNWFIDRVDDFDQQVTINGHNALAVSPAGLDIPVFGITRHQATIERLEGKRVGIVVFRGHRDFPAELISVGLEKKGTPACIIQADAPGGLLENAALAKSFDAIDDLDVYFARLKESVPTETDAILFPAVMGFTRNREVLAAAERIFGMPCLEVPTLPPSIPGMRLEHAFDRHLKTNSVAIHAGAGISQSSLDGHEGIVITDNMDRQYKASIVIVSSGGVLMGGLEVNSYGVIHETSLGLDTYQSEPLNAVSVDQSLNALHIAGVETDSTLRPTRNGSGPINNVFVTGRTLAHWNPAAESSTEGVCISTGWAAAENAHQYLEALNNG